MSVIQLKKNPSRRVHDPESAEELKDGIVYKVVDSPYWRRRLQSADVVEVLDEKQSPADDTPPAENYPEAPSSSPQSGKQKNASDKTVTSRQKNRQKGVRK